MRAGNTISVAILFLPFFGLLKKDKNRRGKYWFHGLGQISAHQNGKVL